MRIFFKKWTGIIKFKTGKFFKKWPKLSNKKKNKIFRANVIIPIIIFILIYIWWYQF